MAAAAAAPNARIFDAVVLGSALYMGRWDRDAVDYLKRNGPDLDRPSDLAVPERTVRTSRRGYSPPRRHAPSGVCATRSVSPPPRPSGGTSTIPAPRACSRDGCPNGDLAGDFRDWDQIRAWADDVADQLVALRAPAGT